MSEDNTYKHITTQFVKWIALWYITIRGVLAVCLDFLYPLESLPFQAVGAVGVVFIIRYLRFDGKRNDVE